MATTTIVGTTGSNSFILRKNSPYKEIDIPGSKGQEFRLTLTIKWEEYRQPSQSAGSLWLAYNLGKDTRELTGIGVEAPIVTPGPETKTFDIVTLGEVRVLYKGSADAHVWLSYVAEFCG